MIWAADLGDIQLLSKFNRGICVLFCVIDIYSKYVSVVSLKDTKGVTITKAFQKTLDAPDLQNKIWVDKGSEFYNRSMKF